MNDQSSNISLSVIVCCYNVEHYLDQSLQCLEKQWGDCDDYEIILVNDGSKDGTINKLNDFKARHPANVKVIDKKQNGGLAAARNSALDIAQGDWIAFFDPDDLLAEGSYVRLLDLARQADGVDMIRFGVKVLSSDELYNIPALSEPLTVDWRGTSLEYMQENTYGTCWCYLYRHEVLEGHRFPRNVIVEDLLFLVPLLLEDKKMIRTETTIYYYFVRANAATSVAHNYNRLSLQTDDIADAIEILERHKQGQPDAIKSSLFVKQKLLAHNMSNRMLLSDKKTNEVGKIVQTMTELNLFPLPGGSMMVRLMNFVYTHLWTLPALRPLYRLFRIIYLKTIRLAKRLFPRKAKI